MSEGWSPAAGHDHGGLIAHQTIEPGRAEPLPTPRRAVCRAPSYSGPVLEVEGVVTHAAGGKWLAFSADYPGWGEWTAWVARSACTQLPDETAVAG